MIIKHRFQDGPGAIEVSADNYELFNTRDSRKTISPSVRLLPGACITMAILISKLELADEQCPMPQCKSVRTSLALGGGRPW